jgi:hypothetical protein
MKSVRMPLPPALTPLATFPVFSQARFCAFTAPLAQENLSGSVVLPKR